YPTKYFPASTVTEFGAYVQDELALAEGRVKLVPGVRFDRYRLRADRHDPIYLSGNAGIEPPTDLDDSAVSPRLGAVVQLSAGLSAFGQYARGFRAPAFDAVNSGFTNFASGYTTLPNPDLKPETSANTELGLRGSWRHGSASLYYFYNRYTDFIDFVVRDFNPNTGLLEFQNQNDQRATIQGIEFNGDARLSEAWTVRASAAQIRGRNDSGRVPLNSIAPTRGVLGLRYAPPTGLWGAEVVASLVAGKRGADVDRTEADQFTPPAYQTVDGTLFFHLRPGMILNLGVFNLFDRQYWSWPDVIGIANGSPVLDRYTHPGRTFAASLKWSR
ncbi:MAG TPA: TonB-dependent receptor, partial [Thermoanaerobaculia bacterium]|nr:TonB-dependent receptor [Thermoanaerobaculia bacterium]